MLPVSTDSSIVTFSTRVSLLTSTFEKSALMSDLPAIRSLNAERRRRSNSCMSCARSVLSAERASRKFC